MKDVLLTESYRTYKLKQLEKTSDPVRQKKWLNEEWELKLNGFKNIFEQYTDIFDKEGKCLCLASRTGQEVASLRDLGFKDSIGIDIVAFEPYTIVGDFHDLDFDDESISLVYTNCVDHVKHPDIWSREINRVTHKGSYLLMNLQQDMSQDEYTVFNIENPQTELIETYFGGWTCVKSESIKQNVHAMNWEILLQKQ